MLRAKKLEFIIATISEPAPPYPRQVDSVGLVVDLLLGKTVAWRKIAGLVVSYISLVRMGSTRRGVVNGGSL